MKVSGTITLDNGAPAEGLEVRLYQRQFGGGKVRLSAGQKTTLDAAGRYAFTYGASPNIELHAVGTDGEEVQLSRTLFGGKEDETLNLLAPAKLVPSTAEFSRLMTAVRARLGGKPEVLATALERGERRDISLLASATGWDARALALAAIAHEHSAATGMPAAAHYALYRAGLPSDPARLARVERQSIQPLLERAVQAGIVDLSAKEIGDSAAAFAAFAGEHYLNLRPRGKLSSLAEFVESAGISEADKSAFASLLKEGNPKDLWTRAQNAQNQVSPAGLAALQLQGKLAYLTLNNVELTQRLQSKLGSVPSEDPRELIDLDFDRAETWARELSALAVGDDTRLGALIPPAIEGYTHRDRLRVYCEELARRVRNMDPQRVTLHQLQAANDGIFVGVEPEMRARVHGFLSSAAKQQLEFKLGQTPISDFFRNHGEGALLPGMSSEERRVAIDDVKTFHRLYSVAPSDAALAILVQLGFKGASDIARLSLPDFTRLVGKQLTDEREVAQLYWKAQQQSATVFNVFATAKQLDSGIRLPGVTGPAETRALQIVQAKKDLGVRFPTLEALFGNVDFCECEQCQSALSPAAYLVDLLHFVDPKEMDWTSQKAKWASTQADPNASYDANNFEKPYDALVARRPDLPFIALTCENTNTELPYIDIVNEVLELLVARDAKELTAFDTGAISAADLRAEPQNITWEAYTGGTTRRGLNASVYPTTLPFDLPLELVRAFLQQLGLPLWKLREVIGRPSRLYANSEAADGFADAWFERLGLGPSDVKVLGLGHPWHELYGYDDEASALRDGQLGNARELSRRLGVSYAELVQLLETGFVNPALDNLIVLSRLGIDLSDVDRYVHPTEATRLTPAQVSAFEARLRVQKVTPDAVRALWSDDVRERVLLLRSSDVGCDFSNTRLEFAKQRAESKAALGLALLKLNVFVRLQRKLGWTTRILDSALRVFIRPSVDALTLETWPNALRTALIYLAHLDEIAERTGRRVPAEALLTLWAPIPTAGVDSLYERLFANPAAIALDPAFGDASGAFQGSSEPIREHVGALRQALGLSSEDIEQISSYLGLEHGTLSLDNLSLLMRHAVLARALGITIAELLVHLGLSAHAPFEPIFDAPLLEENFARDVPWGTIAFLREAELLREAGLTLDVLHGICRHRGSSIDVDALRELTGRVWDALSALSPPAATQSQQADVPGGIETQATAQRHQLGVLQALAAQLNAREPLVTTLVGSVLKDPETRRPLIEALVALRAEELASEGTSWDSYVWFTAAGSYQLLTPEAGQGRLRFGPDDDLDSLEGESAAVSPSSEAQWIFSLPEVRAGQRYRMDLKLAQRGGIVLRGPGRAVSAAASDYAGFGTAMARVWKALDLLKALAVTDAELEYLKASPGALSLDALPVEPVEDPTLARRTFAALLPWIEVAAARCHYDAGDRLVLALSAARRSYASAAHAAEFGPALDQAISDLTGCTAEFVGKARQALGLDARVTSQAGGGVLAEVAELGSPAGLRNFTEAVNALIRLGLNPDDVFKWAKAPTDPAIANQLRAALNGRYDAAAWRRIVQPLSDRLREKKRDALLAYLTHLPEAPYGETAEQLFDYVLLDPGTQPVVLTSRIQLAISSLQLFVQRCLMNLETTVPPSIIDAARWEWMRHYRVWEVNRKFFLFPENWLDPEFRDDKTYLFRELESKLLQGEVSDDLVRAALHEYLLGLESIARLEMMAMYFEPGVSAGASTVHVIGRTPHAPHKYFYRKCSHRMWTPLEPLGVDIDGEHLALTQWRGRLHLFWVTFFEKATAKAMPVGATINDLATRTPTELEPDLRVQLQLNWVEQIQGKWVNRSATQGFIDAPQFAKKGASDAASKREFFIHLKVDPQGLDNVGDDILEVHVSHSMGGAHRFRLFSKLAPPAFDDGGQKPDDTVRRLYGLAPRGTKWEGELPLTVSFTTENLRSDGLSTSQGAGIYPILQAPEGASGFRLLFPGNNVTVDEEPSVPRAVGNPSGYVFAPQGAQHVVYRGTDNNIHDLWGTRNGWFHSDVSGATGARAATGDPHGYALNEQYLHCICYAADDELIELSWSQVDSVGPDADADVAAAWSMETLYKADPAQSAPFNEKPEGQPFGSIFAPRRGVVFRTKGGHLIGIVEGTETEPWKRISFGEGTPSAASDPFGVVLSEVVSGVRTVSRLIYYRGTDGRLHELRSDDGGENWSLTDLTKAAAAAPAADRTRPTAYGFVLGAARIHVLYRDPEGVIHKLECVRRNPGAWNHNALGQAFGKADSDPVGHVTGALHHVIYRGQDQQLHELQFDSTRGWTETVLGERSVSEDVDLPKAESDPTGYAFSEHGTRHIVYRAAGGQLFQMFADATRTWQAGSFSLEHAEFPESLGSLIAPFFYEDQSAAHTFFVEPSLVERTVHDWEEYVVTSEDVVTAPVSIPALIPGFPPSSEVVQVSELTLVAKPRAPDQLYRHGVVLKTSKGVFEAKGSARNTLVQAADVARATLETRLATSPVQVLDATRGTMQAFRSVSVLKDTPGGE